MPQSTDQAAASVRALIGRINAAWREKEFAGLEECFHPDALIMGPGYRVMARGRTACVDSYREFANDAGVLEYSEADHAVYVWDTVAVSTCSWTITYERGGNRSTEVGRINLFAPSSPINGWWYRARSCSRPRSSLK